MLDERLHTYIHIHTHVLHTDTLEFVQCVYDIKYVMKSCEVLKGGLNKVRMYVYIHKHSIYV